jgi:four helix bundle protein
MAGARTFEDLVVWRRAYQFALALYKITDSFPRHELYGLTSQMRRAAVSVPANIAEGFKKRGRLDKARFLNIAQGSVEESRCYLLMSQDLGYGDTKVLLGALEEVSRYSNGTEERF